MNENSIFIRMMSRVGDVMILSVIFTLVCIPILTIGPALSAASYTGFQALDKDDGYIWKRFWRGFRKSFKQSFIAWLICLGIGFILGIDVWYWFNLDQNDSTMITKAMLIISVILLAFFAFIVVHLFPLIGNYTNKLGKMFENAALIVFLRFPMTVLVAVIYAATIWLLWMNIPVLLIFFIVGAGSIIFICSLIHRRLFRTLMKSAETAKASIEEEKALLEKDDEDTEADSEEEPEDEPEDEPEEEQEEKNEEEQEEKPEEKPEEKSEEKQEEKQEENQKKTIMKNRIKR